jgi:hypothetical protein
MSESVEHNLTAVLERIQMQAASDRVRVTQHAQQEMIEEGFILDEVLGTIAAAQVLENYPEHRRGPCCLLVGYPGGSRLRKGGGDNEMHHPGLPWRI